MWKAMLAGTTALTLLGASAVYAQQTVLEPGKTFAQQRSQFMTENYVERTNARIDALKSELNLTPAQEKNWATFETALRESAKQRAEHFAQAREMRLRGERQQRDAAPTEAEIAGQKQLAAALNPLYQSLDEGQKQRFAALFQVDGEGRHFWFRRGGHRDRRS